jgi:hypothetical protein
LAVVARPLFTALVIKERADALVVGLDGLTQANLRLRRVDQLRRRRRA